MNELEFRELAVAAVVETYNDHADVVGSDKINGEQVCIVWMVKVLQNNKCLLSTIIPDGLYYEFTWNGDKNEGYLDVYKKAENVLVKRYEKMERWSNKLTKAVSVAKNREVYGVGVKTRVSQFMGMNILEVEAGTTGFKGGDSGHGGRTYLRFEDLSSTDIKANLIGESGVEIIFGGDSELLTLIEGLKFIVSTLESQKGEIKNEN